MKKIDTIIQEFGGAQALADSLNASPVKPKGRALTRSAVMAWRRGEQVPFAWMDAVIERAASESVPVTYFDVKGYAPIAETASSAGEAA